MRPFTLVFFVIILAASSTAQVVKSQYHAAGSAQEGTPGPQKDSTDSALQFLLTSAAADFHAHGPSQSLIFRDVHLGHLTTPAGVTQYLLCGQFLPAEDGRKNEWTPFATIKTSGYEQMIGEQAAMFCQDASVVWDDTDDLSSLLQSRFDSRH